MERNLLIIQKVKKIDCNVSDAHIPLLLKALVICSTCFTCFPLVSIINQYAVLLNATHRQS